MMLINRLFRHVPIDKSSSLSPSPKSLKFSLHLQFTFNWTNSRIMRNLILMGILFHCILGQEDVYGDDRGLLHKHKKRPSSYYGGGPCGRSARSVEEDPDGKSLKVVAALGGAAIGYHLGVKKGQQYSQQPIINNNIYNSPCGPSPGGGGGGGGLFGHLGGLSGLGGPFPRYGTGSYPNWDRTIRQFNRQVVRPITRWF